MQRLMYGGLDRALVNLTRIYCTAYITTSVWTAYLACLPRRATPTPVHDRVKYSRQMNNSGVEEMDYHLRSTGSVGCF